MLNELNWGVRQVSEVEVHELVRDSWNTRARRFAKEEEEKKKTRRKRSAKIPGVWPSEGK